jgi:pimeloyl-ACP methyl ester carboxylesterase
MGQDTLPLRSDHRLQPRFVRFRGGAIAAYALPETWQNTERACVFLHGAFQDAKSLFHMAELVPNSVFVDLPGHGQSTPLPSPSLETMADVIGSGAEVVLPQRAITWVGESLGALVALQLNRGLVIAVDPPLMISKCADMVQEILDKHEQMRPAWAAVAHSVFGITPAFQEARNFLGLFESSREMPVIITGDWTRDFPGDVSGPRCVLDDADLNMLRPFVRQIARLRNCGHLALRDAPFACAEIINSAIKDLT